MKQICIRTILLTILDYSISTQKQKSERALNSLIKIILGRCVYLMKYEVQPNCCMFCKFGFRIWKTVLHKITVTVWVRRLYHCSFTGQMHEDHLVVLPSTNPIRYENHMLVHKILMKSNTNLNETLWRKRLFAFLF